MTKKVASIYFSEVIAEREAYGGYYRLPAVSKGAQPAVIEVSDKFQRWQKPYALSGGLNSRTRQIQVDLIRGEDIAVDIVAHWTQYGLGMTPSCHPGIWVVRDVLPELAENGTPSLDAGGFAIWRQATEAERKAMWDDDLSHARGADASWAELLIQREDVKPPEQQTPALTAPLAKLAARHYGRDRRWLHALRDSDVKPCQWCLKMIDSRAIVCPECHHTVDFERFALLEAQQKGAVQAALNSIVKPPVKAA